MCIRDRGYDYSSVEEAVKILQNKLQMYETFPHEIGLFLGYPEEDVQGFIENQEMCIRDRVCNVHAVCRSEKNDKIIATATANFMILD